MVGTFDLWLPIVVSSVLVFIASSILHMALPIHKADYRKVPDEDGVRAALRQAGVTPGPYVIPVAADMREMGSPEMKAKYMEGPVAFLTVMPNGVPSMGKSLLFWFLFTALVGLACAYLASLASLPPGAEFLRVFRFVGTVAVIAHAAGYFVDSIWKGSRWSTSAKYMFDGVIYGLITGATFAWLWPAAQTIAAA